MSGVSGHSHLPPKQAVNITQLFSLARDASEAGRIKLAEAVSDVFLAGDMSLSPRESAMVWALIEDLVRSTTANIRQVLAHKLACVGSAPRPIVRQLAGDKDIRVAKAMLEHSEQLLDEDLLEIIGANGMGHAEAIAHRRAISEAVADALIVTGDANVMRAVAENLGARLSVRAVYKLADAARLEEALRPPLVRRPELSGDVATRMYWWVSAELRRFLLRRFGFSSGQVDAALEAALEELLGRYQLDRQDDLAMRQVVNWLAEREVISPKLMVQILRMGHYRLFHQLVSHMCDLPLPLVDLVVAEHGGRALAACARFMAADKPTFVSLFLLSRGARSGDQIVHPRELSFALSAFDKVNKDFAQRMLEMWRRYPNALLTGFNDSLRDEA